MKLISFLLLSLIFSGCGVNFCLRAGIDIDPSLERLTSDIREIADEYKAAEEK